MSNKQANPTNPVDSNNNSNNINNNNNNNNSSHLSMNESARKTEQLGEHSGVVERCLRNFILGKTIGAGTFSKVCIAKHKLTNQQVAIKIIEKRKIQNDADRVRLDREIKIMRKVRHPNIAQLYQIIQTNKYIYLVMEYAARGQLFDHIVSHQKLNEFQASKFLLQLIDAIDYLHQLGIAHRDLKPQNMLLDHKYNIKVTDFGLSNIYQAGKLLSTACGSPSYACPEMLSNKPYDGLKADIWSIGIVLYAMCFGYLPFDNPNISQLYQMIKSGQFQIPDFASQNLIDILQKILQVNPQQRLTIQQIRNHPFCKYSTSINKNLSSIPGIIIGLSQIPFEAQIENEMKDEMKIQTQHLKQQIKKNKHNENTCTYYLILQRNLRTKNQSLSQYYTSKYNTINRYALIQRVKANYDRILRNKMEIKKFQAIQEQIKIKNKGSQSFLESTKRKKIVSKTNFKFDRQQKNDKKIAQSAKNQNHKQKNHNANQNLNDDQGYLKSQIKFFAPNNTKLCFQNSSQKKKVKSKSQSKSKSKSQSKSKSKSKNNSKQKKNTTKKFKKLKNSNTQKIKKQNLLQIPDDFLQQNSGIKKKRQANSRSSQKKGQKVSPNKKKRSKTLQVEQSTRKRNKSVTAGTRLKF